MYDTARALFWNQTDDQLETIATSRDTRRRQQFEKKYRETCLPKTGFNGEASPNHFRLLERILSEYPETHNLLTELTFLDYTRFLGTLFAGEFEGLLTQTRQEFVINCISERCKRLDRIDF